MKPLTRASRDHWADLRFVFTDIDDTLTTDGRLFADAYTMMENLADAGIVVIPVTGRPAGWCDMIARFWPVGAVVGENGAFYFRYDRGHRKFARVFSQSEEERHENRRALKVLRDQILADVPGAAAASDQGYREADLAIDYCEDVPRLAGDAISKIVGHFEQAGANAKVSSIHVNGWFGSHDKLTMTQQLMRDVYGLDVALVSSQRLCAFIGDSPNDSPMFDYFKNSVGVANIKGFGDHCPSLPKWVTAASSSAGFCEFGRAVLAARLLVNAAGPWVDDVLGRVVGQKGTRNIRLVQGSHIVVPKLFEHDRAYIFQNTDGRVVFAIPYEQDFTLIGTTDQDYAGALDDVRISPEETRYICDAASAYFENSVQIEDVVWSYSAVRPLIDDGASRAQEATRDYVLKVEGDASEVKLISIFGGKITTCRRLAETVLDHIDKALGRATQQWTGSQCLPGGDFPAEGASALVAELSAAHPYLEEATARRLVRSYGTLAHDIFAGGRTAADLGEFFAAGLCAREVDYLRQTEWAETVEDILWRRSKLGLHFDERACRHLADWLAAHPNVEPVKAI